MAEFTAVTLAAFVVVLNEIVKVIAISVGGNIGEEKIKRFIPLFSIVFGVILAIVGFYMPDVDMGKNLVEAIFIGLASGASATGYHQVFKQLKKPTDENASNYDIEDLIDALDNAYPDDDQEDEEYDDEVEGTEEEEAEALTPVEKATVDMLQDTDEKSADFDTVPIPEDDE